MSKPILCAAIIAAVPAFALADNLYNLTVLSTDQSFHASGANDSGEFVGFTFDQHENEVPAFFKDGVITNINVPGPGTAPFVGAISTDGDIPVVTQNPTASYIFSNGALTPLPVSTGTFAAQFIGANGEVAGYFIASDGVSGSSAIYHNGQITLLPGDEYVTDVNARGDFLVGTNNTPFILHPDGTTTSLPSITDSVYTHISNNGIAAGYRPLVEVLPGQTPPPPGFFIATNGLLNFIPADSSSFTPNAVNSSGTLVGDASFSNDLGGAAIYQNGTLSLLSDYVASSPWTLGNPLSISDDGTIYLLGDNAQSQTALLELTPISNSVPEPTSLALLSLSFVALQLRRPSRVHA